MGNRKAIILGSTGLVGGHLRDMLLEDENYDQVIAPVRRESPLQQAKLQTPVFDFDNMDGLAKYPADDVFCCLGTTIKVAGSQEAFYKVDCTYPVEAARVMKAAGARRYYIVTALGSDEKSMVFYNRVKGEVERRVREIDFETLEIFRPSLLQGERSEQRPGESLGNIAAGLIGWTLVGPMRKYRAIQGKVVARAMLRRALTGEKGVRVHESDKIQQLGQ